MNVLAWWFWMTLPWAMVDMARVGARPVTDNSNVYEMNSKNQTHGSWRR
jgi:hypothetical protein